MKSKGIINIEIEHDLKNGTFNINVKAEASPNMIMAALSDLLVTTENKLPEDKRQEFRSAFLQALNARRLEALK